MNVTRAAASLVFVAVTGAAACGSHEDAVREETVTVGRVHFASVVGEAPACAPSAAWLDDVMARQATFLGLAPPSAVTYHYRPWPSPLPCPSGVACTDAMTLDVYARPPDMVHELVHAIFDASIGPPASFFDEGAAVALGGADWEGEPPPDYDQPLDPLLGAETLPTSAYTLAGDFVSYLLATQGAAPFVALARGAPHGSSAGTVRSAFASAYGKTVDDLVAERRASERVFTAARLALPECTLAPTAWSGATWSQALRIDCASAGVGPLYNTSPPLARAIATFDVATPGAYHLSFAAAGGFAWVERCDDGATIAREDADVSLAVGRYFVRFEAATDASTTLTMSVAPRN